MTFRCRGQAALLGLVLMVSACGRPTAAAYHPTPVPRPKPTPTTALAFEVGVTDVPPKRHVRHHKAVHPLTVPPGPYLRIIPASGGPIARLVHVYGQHLPRHKNVHLVWSSRAALSTISRGVWTDARGRLAATFRIPASSPGSYRIVVEVGGSPLTSAPYAVLSFAALSVDVLPTASSLFLEISGKHFVAREPLNLVLYPLRGKPMGKIVAHVRTGKTGRFKIRLREPRLTAGEYLLRALATGATTQTASTIFQVVV